MPTLLNPVVVPKRASQKKKVTKPFKLERRDADLAGYKVSTQRAAVAIRNLFRD